MSLRALKRLPARQLKAEARLTRNLQGLFAEVNEKVIDELMRINRLPTDDVALRKIVSQLMDSRDVYEQIMSGEAMEAAQYGRNKVISDLQKAGSKISFSQFSDRTKEKILGHVFEASNRTLSRMSGDVMANLAQSYDDGLGVYQAAERLQTVFDRMQNFELRRIARTEINSFQNEGAHLTERELGVEYHMWYTAEDERVRDEPEASHVEMHGQIVKVGDAFSNGLEYPGDRSGGESTIRDWINCRCRAIPFLVPEGKRAPIGKDWFYEGDLEDI